jgi:IS5 family transposase
MTGNNPTDRSKLGTKRHVLTDKNGISLSVIITSANSHDIKAITDVIDNAVLNRPSNVSFTKKKTMRKHHQQQHLCLDRAYSSELLENEIIRRGYVPNIPYKRKRGQNKEDNTYQKRYFPSKNKRWVVKRGQIHGIIGLESCLQDMKRRPRITLLRCNCLAVS